MQTENVAAVDRSEPGVVYEDDTVIVIDKPAGLMVHEDGHRSEPTVVDWLLARVPEARGVGEPGYAPEGTRLERSGVVHRLDRATSGVMVLAKTATAHRFLKQQFHDRLVRKEYRAFVYGRLNDRWGTINRPIGRSAQDARRRSAERGAKGVLREAITDFERIGMGEYENEPFSYVKLIPKTGRMHQLRVHLRAINRPIVGDTLYAAQLCTKSNNLGFTRLALHAHTLTIVLPSGEERRFIAPEPPEFIAGAERIAADETLW
jgi:23S rRNA pseudouridine1911/1915/1917 synthase